MPHLFAWRRAPRRHFFAETPWTWRDPMRRIPWLMAVAGAVRWPLLVVKGHGSLFAVALPAVMMGLQAGNQYGIEGSGLWLHMVAFADRTRARGEAIGHSVFWNIAAVARF